MPTIDLLRSAGEFDPFVPLYPTRRGKVAHSLFLTLTHLVPLFGYPCCLQYTFNYCRIPTHKGFVFEIERYLEFTQPSTLSYLTRTQILELTNLLDP